MIRQFVSIAVTVILVGGILFGIGKGSFRSFKAVDGERTSTMSVGAPKQPFGVKLFRLQMTEISDCTTCFAYV